MARNRQVGDNYDHRARDRQTVATSDRNEQVADIGDTGDKYATGKTFLVKMNDGQVYVCNHVQ